MGFSPTLLAGRVGIVTGAGSPRGIGRSLVRALADAGALAVYATDLTLDNIPSLRHEVREAGSACEVLGAVLDVTSEEQTIGLVKRVVAEHGRLDFFFANAGAPSLRSLQDTDAAHYDQFVSLHQRAFFLAIRYAGQGMSAVSPEKPRPGGSIIATGSIAGYSGSIADFTYSSTKAAVSSMVQSASVQLSASNVRVNAIAPGYTKTSVFSLGQERLPEAVEAEVTRYQRAFGPRDDVGAYYHHRLLEPEEVANLGLFLASDLSSAVSGQSIVADAGFMAAAFREAMTGPVKPMTPFGFVQTGMESLEKDAGSEVGRAGG
ncbi:hypothetical protein G6O67_002815 [Ophiocordyceps sinensis]|uniref:NAD(P)-binding protein n=1 Tax=Ophiocordyceps sinensis TaxID=72228 RepID=A0A8H4PV43_9HYPO|nr:hypothetical protein G6O67_002815 [Ophiocordyceps sinensis]